MKPDIVRFYRTVRGILVEILHTADEQKCRVQRIICSQPPSALGEIGFHDFPPGFMVDGIFFLELDGAIDLLLVKESLANLLPGVAV